MKLLLDTNVLTGLCHPADEENRPLWEWLERLLLSEDPAFSICIPAIADYEARRGLLHLARFVAAYRWQEVPISQ